MVSPWCATICAGGEAPGELGGQRVQVDLPHARVLREGGNAIEAMIELGRLQEAEPFVDMLEREGRRLDRPWQLAVGARCRGMLLAAHGDINAARMDLR